MYIIMYRYEYDILLDNILDLIYKDLGVKKLKLKDLKKNVDLKKYISKLDNFMSNSNYKEIESSTIIIINVYLYFYIFVNKESNLDEIKTHLINNKIFDTENLGYLTNLFKNFYYLIETLKIFNNLEQLLKLYKSDINYKEVIDILNEFGKEEITTNFIDNKKDKDHNIIKLLILNKLYAKHYRKKIFNLIFLDLSKKETIEIIAPKVLKLDFFNIESLLTFNEKKLGIANDIINLFQELDYKIFDNNNTIIDLFFNLKICVPITDEFLRYHKILEKNNLKTDVSKSKIKNILSKNYQIRDYYSLKVQNNKSLLNEINKLFYKPLSHRKAILYNEFDELNIVQKILSAGSGSLIDYNDFLDLKNLRKSSYVNFKDFKNDGVSYLTTNNFTSVRYAGIESLERKTLMDKNAKVEVRNINRQKPVNIVGLCFLSNYNLKINDLKDIREINDNGIEGCKKLIIKKVNNKLDDNYYWIFNKSKDILEKDDFDLSKKIFDINVIFKYLLNFSKDEITKFIVKKLENYDTLDFYYSKKFVKYYSNKFTKFHINRKNYIEDDIIKQKNRLIKITDDLEDINESKMFGLSGDVIKKIKDNRIIKEENIFYISHVKKEENKIMLQGNTHCQHLIDWNIIKSLKNKNINLQKELIYNFIKKYVIVNAEEDYICKSCKQYLDVKNYLVNDYDGISGIDVVINNKKNLSDMKEYEKYSIIIKNLDKLIERIGRINNLTIYVGNEQVVKLRREEIIKNIIDLIILHEKTLKVKNMSNIERQLDANRKFGINTKFTNFFIFPLTNDLFKSSSDEKDKFKRIKLNTIIVYIILFMILDIKNRSQIIMIELNKICNNLIYDKIKNILFGELKIVTDNSLKTEKVLDNELLCFLIYYFSCNLSTTNTWYSSNNDISLKQKSIVNTFFDFTNSLLEVFSFKKKNYLYDIICTKIINKVNLFKNNKKLLNVIISNNNITYDKERNKIIIKKSNISSIKLENLKKVESELNKFNFNVFYLKNKEKSKINLDKKYLNEIYFKYQNIFENKILSLFDESGVRRKINLDSNEIKKLNIGVKDKILKLYKSKQNKLIERERKKVEYKKIEIDKNVLDKFLVLVKNILKKDNIKIDNTEFNLTKSKLNIKFDFLGNIIKNQLEVFLDDKKISIKNNSYFNMEVYEVFDKVNEIKLLFNKYNLHYLGYLNKNEITDLSKFNLYGKYIPSIKEQFETLGFKKNYYKNNEDLNSLLYETLNNVKMYILLLKDNLYLIKYKKINKSEILDYYINRILNLNMDYDGNKSIFDDLECVNFSKDIDKLDKKKNYEIVSKYELKDDFKFYNIVINYYLKNIIRLIEINNDNFVKVNILEFIIKNNYKFYMNNFEQYYNFEIIKYKNIYNLSEELIEKYDQSEFLDEMNEKDKDEMENLEIDNIEKSDALDMDDIDNEDDDEEVMFYDDDN